MPGGDGPKPPSTASVAEVNTQAARERSRCRRSGRHIQRRALQAETARRRLVPAHVVVEGKGRRFMRLHPDIRKHRPGKVTLTPSPIQRASREQNSARAHGRRRVRAESRHGASAPRNTCSDEANPSKASLASGSSSARLRRRAAAGSIAARSARTACPEVARRRPQCRERARHALLHSASASRASSTSGRAPMPSPKNCAASSGNWCACRRRRPARRAGFCRSLPVSARGRRAAGGGSRPRCPRACALPRLHHEAVVPERASVPRQLSAVLVTSGSNGESSAARPSSARSPMRAPAPGEDALEQCGLRSPENTMRGSPSPVPCGSGTGNSRGPSAARFSGRRRAHRAPAAGRGGELVLQRRAPGGEDGLHPRQQAGTR